MTIKYVINIENLFVANKLYISRIKDHHYYKMNLITSIITAAHK